MDLIRKFFAFVCEYIKNIKLGSSRHGSAVTNPTSVHEETSLIPGLTQWVKDLVLL